MGWCCLEFRPHYKLGAAWPSAPGFGPRCNPGTPSFMGLLKLPPCPECCLVQLSNFALEHGPELLTPAPLRCEEGKGHLEVKLNTPRYEGKPRWHLLTSNTLACPTCNSQCWFCSKQTEHSCTTSPPHTSRAPGFATQNYAQARDSNAAQGTPRTWRSLRQNY